MGEHHPTSSLSGAELPVAATNDRPLPDVTVAIAIDERVEPSSGGYGEVLATPAII